MVSSPNRYPHFAYLNMAGAGPVSDAVLEVTTRYLKIEQCQGAYDTEIDHHYDLDERVYQNLGKLVGCHVNDVALFENATRAWFEIVRRIPLSDYKVIFTTEYEYAGNLQFLNGLAQKHDLKLVIIPCDDLGEIDLAWLQSNMSNDVGLVSVVQVPSCCGIVNPVEEIGDILSGYSTTYCVDACQAAGQIPIEIGRIRCDALTGAGRKFLCGPRGTGFAVVSDVLRNRLSPDFVDLHLSDFLKDGSVTKDTSTARFLELAERNCSAIVALSLAIEEAIRGDGRRTDGIELIRNEVTSLEGVVAIDPGIKRSGIFTFRHERKTASDIVAKLRDKGVAAWRIKGSHTPLYMLPRGHIEAVRLSSNKINLEDAEKAVEVIATVLG